MQSVPVSLALSLCLTLAGCFHAPESPSLKCDSLNACPDQMMCIDSLCVRSVGDGSVSEYDMTIDASSSSGGGCTANNGSVLGTKAEACPGTCAMGQCEKLCNSGWNVCTGSAGIDLALLKAIGGLYVADVPGSFVDPLRSQTSCGLATAPEKPVLFGGGKPQANVTDNPAKPCAGFTQSIDCGSAPLTFLCAAPYDFKHVSITDGANGVLCCKP